MKHLRFKIEDRQLRLEDSIIPYQHLIHMFVLCRESRYFEGIVKFLIFRLRTINNFFQVFQYYCPIEAWH